MMHLWSSIRRVERVAVGAMGWGARGSRIVRFLLDCGVVGI